MEPFSRKGSWRALKILRKLKIEMWKAQGNGVNRDISGPKANFNYIISLVASSLSTHASWILSARIHSNLKPCCSKESLAFSRAGVIALLHHL